MLRKIIYFNNEKMLDLLSDLFNEKKFDAIGEMPGYTILEKRDPVNDKQIWNDYDCGWYVKQKMNTSFQCIYDMDPDSLFNFQVVNKYREVYVPQKNDLVFYSTDRGEANSTHIGIYLGGGYVESKFNEGHVYRHPLNFVPEQYGKYTFFHRRKSEEFFSEIPLIESMDGYFLHYAEMPIFKAVLPKGKNDAAAQELFIDRLYRTKDFSIIASRIADKGALELFIRVFSNRLAEPEVRQSILESYFSAKGSIIEIPSLRARVSTVSKCFFLRN
jgi:hypothetical protein